MANRTTSAEVIVITGSNQSGTVIDSFITTANMLVTATLGGYLSDALLTDIEKWLAAHLLSVTLERQTVREEIGGDTNEQYAKLGLGLDSTTFGQTVKLLDSTGRLFNLGRRLATIEAVTSFED